VAAETAPAPAPLDPPPADSQPISPLPGAPDVAWYRVHPERLLAAFALFFLLFVLRWFDVGLARPFWLERLAPLALLLPALVSLAGWLVLRWQVLLGPPCPHRGALGWSVAAALIFRLPFVAQGAAGAVTPDGALSGIVMLRVMAGAEHLVFIPSVPYSGSLKSHLAAGLAAFLDPARAFALASVLFYLLFVAAVVCLACLLPRATPALVMGAGLYAAFAPPFVTRYSLSNDGNYVEVLALGTWSVFLAVRLAGAPARDKLPLGLAAGLALGLAFWCHILAVIPLVAVALFLLLMDFRAALRAFSPLAAGWALANAPGLLWNLVHEGESFGYLLPGGPRVGGEEAGPALPQHLALLLTDHLPALLGRDTGYGPLVDGALTVLGGLGALLFGVAVLRGARDAARDRHPVILALVAFVVVNLAVAVTALPYLPGNARYVLFLAGPAAVLLSHTLAPDRRGRLLLAGLVGAGALASLAQLPGTARADARWRGFVADLEASAIGFCYTDFYLATKINFLSGERVICTAKLGPTATEYFLEYRDRVEKAPRAALVAVNATAGRRLEARLRELGVPFTRHDLMKPVLVPERKVDPQELFPSRAFPRR
jgi:hypothetical protein